MPFEFHAYKSCGALIYNFITGGAVEIMACLPGFAEIDIPPMIDSCPVTKIHKRAFSDNTSLVRISFPDCLEEIGEYAFRGCEKLQEIVLPDGLKIIEDSCFAQCFQLKSVRLPAKLETIGTCAFKDCVSLKGIDIPEACTEIAPDAFQECPSLAYFHVSPDNPLFASDDGILYNKDKSLLLCCPEYRHQPVFLAAGTEFAPEAFDRCMWIPAVEAAPDHESYASEDGVLYDKSMTTLLFLPQGRRKVLFLRADTVDIAEHALDQSFLPVMQTVEGVVDFAWIDCCSLPFFDVDEDNPAFSDFCGVLYDKEQTVLIACYGGFRGELVIPDTVSVIDCGAVSGCGGVTDILLPDDLQIIDNAAFASCTALRCADIPASVTNIGEEAFLNCFALESVIIRNPAAEIGADAFTGCLSLTICGKKGSAAEQFAEEGAFVFRVLEE